MVGLAVAAAGVAVLAVVFVPFGAWLSVFAALVAVMVSAMQVWRGRVPVERQLAEHVVVPAPRAESTVDDAATSATIVAARSDSDVACVVVATVQDGSVTAGSS